MASPSILTVNSKGATSETSTASETTTVPPAVIKTPPAVAKKYLSILAQGQLGGGGSTTSTMFSDTGSNHWERETSVLALTVVRVNSPRVVTRF